MEIQSTVTELKREMEEARQRHNQSGVFSLDIQIITLQWVLNEASTVEDCPKKVDRLQIKKIAGVK